MQDACHHEPDLSASATNLGTPCRLSPLSPFAMLNRPDKIWYFLRETAVFFFQQSNEWGEGSLPTRRQVSQEFVAEALARHESHSNIFSPGNKHHTQSQTDLDALRYGRIGPRLCE